jgi:hypothetical protein
MGMKLNLTRREARHALIHALENKYPDVGILGHRAVEIEVIEAEEPHDIAIEATLVTEED